MLVAGPEVPVRGLHEAFTICSVAGDLKINETVDLPNWLVSMTLPAGSSRDRASRREPRWTAQVAGDTATAQLHLVAGQTVCFALQHGQMQEPPLAAWEAGQIAARLQDTIEGWRSWSALHQAYEGPWRDLVHHSGRVLQALTFAPTGAIVAAPTTSLPEAVGGERNWDYRYTWVRDASLTMEALWVAACPDEAGKFFGFLADAVASELRRGKELQIMFGVGGEHDLSERELPHLAGRRASRPVRVGNGAWTQRQLDVYGELLDAAQRLADQRGLVYRYLAHDGLAGGEGTFLLCTFWLAHAQALAGELDQATATFERAVAAINDVGLLAEEVDPGSGEMIGNFPQAFSHIGLVNAAWAISQAQVRAAEPDARQPYHPALLPETHITARIAFPDHAGLRGR